MIVIVGCGKRKQAVVRPAGELYTGSLFRASRRYAEALGARWAVLSAEHGLVLPSEPLAPYDNCLRLTGEALRQWAARAAQRYVELFGEAPCQCLAGQRYSAPFAKELGARRVASEQPLVGYELGPRLSWLKARYS